MFCFRKIIIFTIIKIERIEYIYKLSGKPGNIFIIGVVLGPVLILLISIIYAYIDVYNPLFYLTWLVYLGLLIGVVVIQKMVIRISKCRSHSSAIIYGIVVGLFGLYAAWCSFFYVLYQREGISMTFIDIITNPAGVFDDASSFSEVGWKMRRSTISGGFLWFIWIIEAIGIVGAGIVGGLFMMHEEVFCENCNRWAEDVNLNLRLKVNDEVETKAIMEKDLNHLLSLEIEKDLKNKHLKLNIRHCKRCENTTTLDVDLITSVINKKGEHEEKSADYSPVYLISKYQHEKLIRKKTEE